MTSIDNKVSGSTISKYAYSYDALGRRGDRTQSGTAVNTPGTDDFAYNTRSEVIASTNSVETAAAWNPSFDYDKIGNRKWSTGFQPVTAYGTNALNQYTALDSAIPIHDPDGNLTYAWNNDGVRSTEMAKPRRGEEHRAPFGWGDEQNRLSSATNGTTTIDFTYDYQGRLVKKDDGADVEVYVYDGWNRIFQISNPGSQFETTKAFLWGLDLSGSMQGAGGVGGLLSESEVSNGQISNQRYALYDANGNIMQKLDGAGAAVMSVDYDPFGNIIAGTLVGEYGFSTKPLVNNLDWYYYGFRYYDPVTGRWPSRDPIGEQGGSNLYAMLRNGLVNGWDYSDPIPRPRQSPARIHAGSSTACRDKSEDFRFA